MKRKMLFPFHYARLASLNKIGCGSVMKRKKAFFFSLRSPCTIFALKYTYAKVEKRN